MANTRMTLKTEHQALGFFNWTFLILRCFYVVTTKCKRHLDIIMKLSHEVALIHFVILHLTRYFLHLVQYKYSRIKGAQLLKGSSTKRRKRGPVTFTQYQKSYIERIFTWLKRKRNKKRNKNPEFRSTKETEYLYSGLVNLLRRKGFHFLFKLSWSMFFFFFFFFVRWKEQLFLSLRISD